MAALHGVTIRQPVVADAAALARLHVEVWEDAYAGLMPASLLAERRAGLPERVERWRAILAESASRTRVAEAAGALVGFVSSGPARDDDVAVTEELWALYVRAAWWGRGLGHALLVTSLADRPACLWVLRGNDRAIGFYRRHGFVEDGAERTDEHGTELRMVRGGAVGAIDQGPGPTASPTA